METSGAEPSESDLQALAGYVGWGGLQEAFKRPDGSLANGWSKQVVALADALTPAELASATKTTTDAHYTSREVIAAMWEHATYCGFNGGRVLEPALGIGNFLGMLPASVAGAVAVEGVETDSLTARIATLLYPGARIAHQGFEASARYTPDENSFDLVITNPPFGNQSVYDSQYPNESKHSIHNYFVLKSLAATRPNGLVAMVISRYFLDTASPKARAAVAEIAEFMGAVRLPNTAFKSNAGTEVTSDVVFFRKREPDEQRDAPERGFESVVPVEDRAEDSGTATINVNEWYARNPQMMLGKWGSFGGTVYGEAGSLAPLDGDPALAPLLATALKKLPGGFMPEAKALPPPPIDVDPEIMLRPHGEFFVVDNQVLQRDKREAAGAVVVPARTAREVGLYRGFVSLRGCLEELVAAELAGDDMRMGNYRGGLGDHYNRFVRAYGYLNRPKTRRLLSSDPGWSKVAALEMLDGKENGRQVFRRAEIFDRRVLSRWSPPETAKSSADALAASLAVHGKVNLPYMCKLCEQGQAAILEELGERIFQVALGEYETADAFLSGDVKAKLERMQGLALADPAFAKNVAALEGVIPADIHFSDIAIKLGSHWLPPDMLSEFVQHLYERDQASAVFVPATGEWAFHGNASAEANIRWATPRAPLSRILRAVSKQKSITITDHVGADMPRIFNPQATAAANAKADMVKDEFQRWLGADVERRQILQDLYNAKFNNTVERQFDGAHQTFPGKVDDSVIKLKDYQSDAVWRIVSGGNPVLLHHSVGAGKTFTMIAAVMEMRRLGLAKKPMLVVPNNMVVYWQNEFNKLYPNARVFAPNKSDYTADNRAVFFARVALSDWDAVIVASSSFDRIRVDARREIDLLERAVAEMLDSQEMLKITEGARGTTVKEMSRRIKRMTAKVEKLADAYKKQDGFLFDELGIDALLVDESQQYKNLFFTSSLGNVAGIGNPEGSRRALQMFLKSRDVLESTQGRNLVFASGTPVSNSIAEVYSLQRYLDYGGLKKLGLAHFDAWANMFGEIKRDYEITPTQQYKQVGRLAKFGNLPELRALYAKFADIKTRAQLEKERRKRGDVADIPPVVGGKPTAVIAERSDKQADLMDRLAIRAGNLVVPDNMLAVIHDARQMSLDYRLAVPSAPDFSGSKVNLAATKIHSIWADSADVRGTQLVFLDLSTPKAGRIGAERLLADARGGDKQALAELDAMDADERANFLAGGDFSVYDDLRNKLIDLGVDSREIEFVHSAKTDVSKAELFQRTCDGEIRILLGSTQLLGAGVNVQKRLVALHHLDCPWRPSDVAQREGRIKRPGNQLFKNDPDFKIQIFRYATKQTMDAWLWQTIETKAKFIHSMLEADSKTREFEDDINEAEVAAVMKAEASGDPRLLEDVELTAQIRALTYEQNAHKDQVRVIESALYDAVRTVNKSPKRIAALQGDVDLIDSLPSGKKFTCQIGDKTFTDRKAAGAELMKICKKRLAAYAKATGGFDGRARVIKADNVERIGSFGKFNFWLVTESVGVFEMPRSMAIKVCSHEERCWPTYLCGSEVDADSSPVGLMNSIRTTLTKSLPARLADEEAALAKAEESKANLTKQLEDGNEWPNLAKLRKLKTKSASLKRAIVASAEKAREERTERRENAEEVDRAA